MCKQTTNAAYTRADSTPAFVEDTVLEAPETPAPVFAVRAFKQALFGTPQPGAAPVKRRIPPTQENKSSTSVSGKDDEKEAKAELNITSSPTKPQGILLTPGTAALRRKQVTFGEHVIDNEGKKAISRSGIPNDCPGKFPSPWTPKTLEPKSQESAVDDNKEGNAGKLKTETLANKSKPTVVLISDNASENKGPKAERVQVAKPRAKDDVDLTITVLDPKSESGKYWKQQYLSYSANSEDEVKKLIAKAKIAKDYAKKKDHEAMELRRHLETERRKRQSREKALEQQVKDLQERLRVTLAENAKTVMELAALRQQLDKQNSDPPRESWKTALETQPPTPDHDSLWLGAAASDTETSYIPKSTASTKLQRTKSAKEPREKPVHQVNGVRTRAGSVVDRKRDQATTPPLDFFKTVLSPIKGSPSSPLQPKSPNIIVSPPRVKARLVRNKPSEHRKAGVRDATNADAMFDPSATAEALGMQADQPITPASVQKERRHRVAGRSPAIPDDRAAAAKDRLAAKRKEREAARERRVKMNTVV